MRRVRTAAGRTVCLVALALALAPGAAGAADWRPVQLPPPPGGRYEVPVGPVGDLQFWSPNRGLMTVGGTSAVPEGLYSWDGTAWHQLATVCGGASNARIAWAGPTEFWVIAKPSLPRAPQLGGYALCHFRDGEVVGSYSTPTLAADAYQQVFAAACNGPSDCVFGGVAAETATRRGAFHLQWDGSQLRQRFAPQGRAVSDVLASGDGYWSAAYAGAIPWNEAAPLLAIPEDPPLLLGRVTAGGFARDPFRPAPVPGQAADATELHALDGDGTTTLAVGGRASSGPALARRPEAMRTPLVARWDGAAWRELTLHGDALPTDMTFNDVAVMPGTGAAWAALNWGPSVTASAALAGQPLLARVDPDGTVAVHDLGDPAGPQRGSIVRVDCPAADDCWAATSRGYLFRWGTAGSYPRDEDPAFQGTITQRPNEALEQSVPDELPIDDALLVAPPIEVPPAPEPLPACETVRSTVTGVRVGKPRPAARRQGRGRRRPQARRAARARDRRARRETVYRLPVRFRVTRRARIALVARRGRRVVARSRARTLGRGRASVTLTLSRSRWPTSMRFDVRDLDPPPARVCSGTGGDDEFAVATSLAAR